MDPFCSFGSDIKTACHCFLYCSNFLEEKPTLLRKTSDINSDILTCAESGTLLFGDTLFDKFYKNRTLVPAIAIIVSSKRLEGSIFFCA